MLGQDRLGKNSKKRKWLVQEVDELQFGANKFEEFTVLHDYLLKYGQQQSGFYWEILEKIKPLEGFNWAEIYEFILHIWLLKIDFVKKIE